ncbi:flagellar protein FliJ [Vibrio variabilis]|uniref:Flagellar protein FliJ n=1 Tax=Vibrio variabilis TaxID=990271 RepID=A0ABQ0JNB1_9VIBR|nr:flagellar protein FliJ [Vibrio variabilis]
MADREKAKEKAQLEAKREQKQMDEFSNLLFSRRRQTR